MVRSERLILVISSGWATSPTAGGREALGPLCRGTWWGGTWPGRMSCPGTSPCCGAVRAGTAAVPPSSAASRPSSSPPPTVSSKTMLGGSFLYYWFYCDERNPTTFYRPTHKYLTLGLSQVISLTLPIATPQYGHLPGEGSLL